MRNCSFCDYPSFESQVVYSNKYWLVVFPRRPLSEGHLMLVSRRHFEDFTAINSKEAADLFRQVKKLDNIFKSSYKSTGSNLFSNKGRSAGQSIAHCHFHLVPRKESEKVSPFEVFNNKGKYEKLARLTPRQISRGIDKILKYK